MTIVVASNNSGKIHFSFDTAVFRGDNLFESQRKVRPLTKKTAIGFAGLLSDWYLLIKTEIGKHPERSEVETIRALISEVRGIGGFMSFIVGSVESGAPKLYAFDNGTGHKLEEVLTYGIGSGIYPEISEALKNVKGNMKELEEIVQQAKKLDRERDNMLYGFGTGVLNRAGYRQIKYQDALKEYFNLRLYSSSAASFSTAS